MVDRTNNRSNSYQWVIVEQPTAPDMLAECSDAQNFSGFGDKYNEEYLELKDELFAAYWRMVETQLTTRQKQVLKLSAQGLTQIEIAKILSVNQSSITKSLNGNCDYRNGKKVYGGCKKKLTRLANQDPEIQKIRARMNEIKDEAGF